MKFQQSKIEDTLIIVCLVLVLLTAYSFYSIYDHQKQLLNAQDQRYKSYQIAAQLRQSSDELTRLVRTFVATNNPKFEKHYWQVLAIRNGEHPLPNNYDRIYWDFMAIENGTPPFGDGQAISLKSRMQKMNFSKEEFALLEKSQTNSDELVNLEIIAINAMKGKFQDDQGNFTLAGEPNQQLALDILFGEKYHQAKISIMAPINDFYANLSQRTETEVNRSAQKLIMLLELQIVLFILAVLTILILFVVAQKYHQNIVNILNQRVTQRTEKLQNTLDEIKTLKGIIPICSECHSIRDDEGAWNQMEIYISSHTSADFSHGICPKCEAKIREKYGMNKK